MKPLGALCAGDLMSADVIVIPEQMSLQGAARILSRAQVSGAPVVDSENRCIGVLSALDFLHWAENGGKAESAKCLCSDTAWKPWQMLDQPEHAATLVGDVMTRNPVMAARRTTIAELARMMLDAHIHRVLVVDAGDKPVGIVSSTDILAAVARNQTAHESLN